MVYLSELLNQPVRTAQGATRARVVDAVVALAGPDAADTPPRLHGLLVRTGWRGPGVLVPAARFTRLAPGAVTVDAAALPRDPYQRGDRELRLVKDLWDRQVIDMASQQVRRVNDVLLGPPGPPDLVADAPAVSTPPGEWVLQGADIGVRGMLRRLGIPPRLARRLGLRVAVHLVPWAQLEIVATGVLGTDARPLDLNRLHPVEIAHLTEQISIREAADLLAALADTRAADVLEELPADRQVDLLEFLPDTRAADILEEMDPDDAADLLGDLPHTRTAALLAQMAPAAGDPVRMLLHYPDHTAGGMMTTRFLRAATAWSAGELIRRLREAPALARATLVYYIYIVEQADHDRLVGVLSLRELLLAEPTTPLTALMAPAVRMVTAETAAAEVARIMAEYNLLGLPVVDAAGAILGVVTVDDALDVLLPAGWQRRLPRVLG